MDDLAKNIHEMTARMLEIEDYELGDDDLFVELDMDSLQAVQLTAMLENEYDITIPDERIKDMLSVNKTVEIVKELIGK